MLRNFKHVGLIHAILPNAKIIDVRRDPLDCRLANFKQMFGPAYAHSYDLADLGKYYNAYLDLMAHYDTVLPGKVHRVSYEELVEDPEAEVRKLLAYLALPFEEQCLRFSMKTRAPFARSVRSRSACPSSGIRSAAGGNMSPGLHR